jgi:hypothetical protein
MAPPQRKTSFSEALAYMRTSMEFQSPARRLSRSLGFLQANLMSLNRCTPPKQDCIYRAFDKANAVNVFFTSFPFEGMVTKRLFCSVFLLIFIQYFFLTINIGSTLFQSGKIFRFAVLEIREMETHNVSTFRINSIGILRDGLPCRDLISKSTRFENIITLVLNQSIAVNGWYFTTSNSSILFDPVRFTIEVASSEAAEIFTTIGASSSFITDYGEQRFRPSIPYDTKTERNAREFFDLRLPWQILAQYRVRAASSSACYLWLFSCYFTKYYHSARWAVAISMVLSCIVMLSSAISLSSINHVTALLIARSMSMGAVGWMAARHEHDNPLPWLLLNAASQALATAAQSTLLDWDTRALCRAAATVMLPDLTMVCLGAWWLRRRRRVERESAALVQRDLEEYERIYAGLLAASRDPLERLRCAVKDHARRSGLPPARRPQPDVEAPPWRGVPAPLVCRQITARGAPATSLSQLFAAAEVLDPLLRRTLLRWGAAAGALVPVENREPSGPGEMTYVRLGERDCGREPAGIKWAALKGARDPRVTRGMIVVSRILA